MDRRPIYVAGYPKSGTTWLTWLLADALDSPSGGSTPKEDRKELATEGQDRPGPYIVRKGHFVLMEGAYAEPVPSRHRLVPGALTDERVVWIIRDPRDIAVSAKFYFYRGDKTILEILKHMHKGTGPFRSIGPWQKYVLNWMDFGTKTLVKYERLIEDPFDEIRRLIVAMGLDVPSDKRIREAIKRQSFDTKKKEMETDERPNADIGRRLLRVGRPGGWRINFTQQDCKDAAIRFNALLIRLGYVEDGGWWQNV